MSDQTVEPVENKDVDASIKNEKNLAEAGRDGE